MATAIPVDRLSPGDHACLTYSDPEERLDILAAFVANGLDQGDKIVCYTDSVGVEDLGSELLDREVPVQVPLRKGGLRILRTDQAWSGSGRPCAAEWIDRLAQELAQAESEGFPGLRITADMCWATRPQADAEQLLSFESEVGKLFANGRLTAICQYDRQQFDPVTLAFAARVHPRTVAATVYHEDPVLRICRQHVPPGVRVAGELDYTRADALSGALSEAMRLDRDVHVNLNGLRFIDAGAASVILQAASSLPAPRQMFLVCRAPIDRTLSIAGATDVPGLRIRVHSVEH